MKKFLYLFAACFLAGCGSKYEYPFQNPSLAPEKRAADVVSRLTLEEKVMQMVNGAAAIERLGIPAYNWWNECLHGVGRTEFNVTVYPQAIGMAAGWDAAAMKTMGDFTAEEARAVYNISSARGNYEIYHGLTFWTPNINIFRDPRWGRGQETYGEDPFLTGTLGKNFVEGLQGSDPHYLKAAACAKHYAVHSGPESNRHSFDASVSAYDLWDTYLPAFQELVEDAQVAGVMCAYNAFEGQPCCGSDKLMTDILRNDWNFTGYVTSDCGAINDFYNYHKTHPDAESAAADAVIHGTDVDCGYEAYSSLVKAVKDGKITESQIDVSLKRLFTIRFRLGMFDPKEKVPFSTIDSTALEAATHKAHALKMSQQSIVLLKNDGILPLDKSKIKKIALMGPNLNDPEVQLGNYNGFPSKIITPLDGIKAKLSGVEIIAERGCNYTNNEMIDDMKLSELLTKDFTVEFFNNEELKGEPVYKGTCKKLYFRGKHEKPMAKGVNEQNFSSRFVGEFESPRTGTVEFRIRFDDGYRLFIDGKKVMDSWTSHTDGYNSYRCDLVKGKKYTVKLEHVQHGGDSRIGLELFSVDQLSVDKITARVKDADAIIFFGGISPRLEGEEMPVTEPGFFGGDRTTILLPEAQTNLMKILKATGKPVIFVEMCGSAIATPWESANVNAIVNTWYGGEFAGQAIADVLFGDYNPAGRLPVTIYAADSDLPDFEDYNMSNRTYKYFKGKALYPFGYGLSYTTFAYEWTAQPDKSYKADGIIKCTLTVKNTGKRDGDAVPQVYVKYPQGGKLPLKELRTFTRTNIKQGQSYKMEIAIPASKLAKWDDAAGKLVVPTGAYTIFAGGSSDDEAATAAFEIE